jgi:hypothetical protein
MASNDPITAGICDQRNGGLGVKLHSSNLKPPMSALGQKQTLNRRNQMSALPPKADIADAMRNVRFVPKADICGAAKFRLFDHLVGAGKQLR